MMGNDMMGNNMMGNNMMGNNSSGGSAKASPPEIGGALLRIFCERPKRITACAPNLASFRIE
jgi:hypothetical protein